MAVVINLTLVFDLSRNVGSATKFKFSAWVLLDAGRLMLGFTLLLDFL